LISPFKIQKNPHEGYGIPRRVQAAERRNRLRPPRAFHHALTRLLIRSSRFSCVSPASSANPQEKDSWAFVQIFFESPSFIDWPFVLMYCFTITLLVSSTAVKGGQNVSVISVRLIEILFSTDIPTNWNL
jgi:hypothetical protein